MHARLSRFALVALAAAVSAPAFAQGTSPWSRFRGPNGSGIAETEGLPAELGPEKNVFWRTELPPGHSSPILSPTRIFLTAVEGETLLVLCLDRGTGDVVWRREAPRSRVSKIDARNNAASPSPAVDADTVVVFFEDFGLVAYDHDGEELWRVPLGPFDNLYGMGASPILVGDRAILACDQNRGSFCLAVSKVDGEELWRAERPEAKSGHSTPILFTSAEGREQIVLPGSFYLDAYDVETGARAWWVSGLSFEMKSVPVLVDGTVYINGYGSPMNDPGNQIEMPPFADVVRDNDAAGNGDGLIQKDEMPPSRATSWFSFVDLDADGGLDSGEWAYLRAALQSKNGVLAIEAGGEGDMTEESVVWTYHRSIPQLPSPLVYDDVLYLLNDMGGLITTFHPKSGEVRERGRIEGARDAFYASPIAADGKIYLVSLEGLVVVLPAGGSLEPLSVSDLGENCYATPAIDAGRIYLRTTEALYCFGLEDEGGDERSASFDERVEHGFVDSEGVKIHYATLGEGPLVVMLHGFPDYWYTWRHQMEALSVDHKTVAIDLRGYNESDKPEGVDNYAMRLLMGDVAATVRHFGEERAVIVGHDWGGAIAWNFAMYYPQMTDRLIICNLPHPRGLMREFAENPAQQANSQYARDFQAEGAHESLTADGLASWVTDESARHRYVEAFERSDFEAMLNYYKRNFPRGSNGATTPPGTAPPATASQPPVKAPVLQIHGLDDKALLAAGLNDTWEWLESDLTLVTIPGAGHFVQQDAADLVTRSMMMWLHR